MEDIARLIQIVRMKCFREADTACRQCDD